MIDLLNCLSFNSKGLTDPARAVSIKKWMVDNGFSFDLICLQEIKCAGFVLDFNLKRINSSFSWFSSVHDAGRGGIVIGVSSSLAKDIVDVFVNKSWVCVDFGGELNFKCMSVYAPCSPRERAQVWSDIAAISGDVILCGDFNMVEYTEDRFQHGRIC